MRTQTKQKIKSTLVMLMFSATLITGLFVTTSPPVSAEGENWWNNSWTYRSLITISNTFVDTTLLDYPVFVRIWDNTTMTGNVKATGQDIAFIDFTDNSTQFAHEIDYFNDDANYVNASFWVNVSELSSSAPTKFWMYYGNAGASHQEDRIGTWNMTKYFGVYHFNNTLNDSTGNYHNFTYYSTQTSTSGTPTYAMGNMSIGWWTNITSWANLSIHLKDLKYGSFHIAYNLSSTATTDNANYLIMKTNGHGYKYYVNPCAITKTHFKIFENGGNGNFEDNSFPMPTDYFQYLGFVLQNGQNIIAYQRPENINGDTLAVCGATDEGTSFCIGGRDYNAGDYWEGMIDDLQLMNSTYITANEIDTTMDNHAQVSGFLTLGGQETRDTSVTVTNSNPTPTNGATGQEPNPTLEITVNCNTKKWMNQTFWSNSSGSWAPFQVNASCVNGTLKAYPSNFTEYSTTYYWSSNLSYNGSVWDNDTYYFTTRGASSGWTDGWTINMAHTCSPTGYLYGNWSFSEHVPSGAYNEDWIRSTYSLWTIQDDSSWWAGNYTMQVNYTNTNNSFSLLNSSGCNRSQVFGWVHSNESIYIWPYLIFDYTSASDFHCIMWSSIAGINKAYILHWNGSVMLDLYNDTVVEDPLTDATNIYNANYNPGEGYYLNDYGHYYKYIYNGLNGSLKFKWWGPGFMEEPVGWAFEVNHTNLTDKVPNCQGVGVWNNLHVNGNLTYDLMSYWQLNYTTNSSTYCDINGYNESRPHMEFPAINASDIEPLLAYFNDSFDGNISIASISDIMRQNFTNPMNLESRMFEMKSPEADEQNDNVYYYSCMIYDFSEIDPETLYEDFLHLHVQHCPEYQIDTDEYGDLIIGIDVDNNRQWDANDRAYWAYIDDGDVVLRFTFDGNGNSIPNVWGATLFQSDQSAVGNLHKYNSFVNYVANIPLADLVKEDGHPLNGTDVFGLSIVTTMSGNMGLPCIWQNWNETSESPFHAEDSADAIDYFFTEIGEGGKGANHTSLTRWGEGVITGYGASEDSPTYNASVQGFIDPSYTDAGDTYKHVNITFWCNATGSGPLTNVDINMSWWNCTCADLVMTYINSSFPHSNITYYNATCNISIDMGDMRAGANRFHYLNVNVTACPAVTTAVERINMSVNATEMTEANEMSPPLRFNWGLYATRVCVSYTTPVTDIGDIGNTVFSIIGVLMIIGSIMMIVFIVKKYQGG